MRELRFKKLSLSADLINDQGCNIKGLLNFVEEFQ